LLKETIGAFDGAQTRTQIMSQTRLTLHYAILLNEFVATTFHKQSSFEKTATQTTQHSYNY